MTTLSDLIARLEVAKEGSRELDRAIRDTLGLPAMLVPPDGGDEAQEYTTSLDAALKLVPEGWKGVTIETTAAGFWLVSLSPVFQTQPVNCPCYAAICSTAPLAVCAATMKAREARR